MIKKSLLIWLSIIPLAILNGGLRQVLLESWLGESCAQIVSGIILCLLIFTVSFIFIPRIGRGTAKTYCIIGLLWVLLTIVFETGLGFLTGMNCTEVIKAYDVTTGNLWSLVVIFTGIAPWLVAKIRKLINT
jgi:hypothetical protein